MVVWSLSCPTLAIPETAARQAPLSMGFSRQEYWSALPSPSPGDLPEPGMELGSPALQVDSLPTELGGKSWEVVRDANSWASLIQNPKG